MTGCNSSLLSVWRWRQQCRFHEYIDTCSGHDGPRRDVLACTPIGDRSALGFTSDQKYHLLRTAKARGRERHALRWRFGCIVYRQGVRRPGDASPVVLRKQTCGMAVLTEPEQYQIEITNRPQGFRIGAGRLVSTELCRYHVHLKYGNGHLIKPNLPGHAGVTRRILWMEAAFITEIDVPCGPIRIGHAQRRVDRARCISARKHKMKLAAFVDGTRSRIENFLAGGVL